MKKFFSLIKASMSEGMNLFRISTKKNSTFTKVLLPIILAIFIMGLMYSYSETIIEKLEPANMQFVLLTLFIIATSLLAFVEGIYKSGNLLFNCRDDNMLLSLPIKKSTILFIRIFKFYTFELLYNSLFLIPAIIVYAIHTNPDVSYYFISIIGILLFPIIPILLSCIIGTFTTFVASKFKGKSYVQTILTIVFLLAVMYVSSNSESVLANIASNASNINEIITKIYYPAGAYIELITNFNPLKLLEFVLIHLGLFAIVIAVIGRIYFNINSGIKSIKTNKKSKKNKEYKIVTSKPIASLIKKEFSRFINSTVFVTNAGFGMIIFLLGCILAIIKFDSLAEMISTGAPAITLDYIKSYVPAVLLGFICFSSFTTSITSSMISLEGRSFNILKSLPIKPYKIVQSKVLTAILVMIPFILLGDIIVFVKFKFDILNIILILISSIIIPLIAETIGILVNLKYPKMDAQNDTEVVKQSMSSTLCVFIGLAIIGLTIFLLFQVISTGIENNIIMLIFTCAFTIIYLGLLLLLHKTCDKSFENINA